MAFQFEVEKKSMEIKLYGEVYKLRFATWAELDEWDAELAKLETATQVLAHQKSLLIKLGLPEEVAQKVDTIDIKPIMRFIIDPEGANAKKS